MLCYALQANYGQAYWIYGFDLHSDQVRYWIKGRLAPAHEPVLVGKAPIGRENVQ